MDPAVFEQLQCTLEGQGADAAIAALCDRMREQRDYTALFYAMLLKKRYELGVSPIPTGPSQDIPEALHPPYEEAIRLAARQVGQLYLQEGQLTQAWPYFRMIDEPEPVRAALDRYQPGAEEEMQPLVHLAYYEGVHPRKGFDWILERYGICNAITTVGGGELPFPDDVKHDCLRALVRALYAELRGRVTAEVETKEGKPPPEADAPPGTPGVILRLIAGRDWLFEEGWYHIDTSHLSSVIQLSTRLPRCPELGLARELCAYGQKLAGVFLGQSTPPFENFCVAYDHYLAILTGEDVEGGLAYFRARLEECDLDEVGTYPAEVLVELLLRLDRGAEAVAVARKHLAARSGQQTTCPSVSELCQKFGDYRTLAEVAREQGDPVHFMAGLLAARQR
jgi:hypothetical protein